MPNLIKQYWGEIRPAAVVPDDPGPPGARPDTVSGFGGASDVSMEPTDERHALLDRAFIQSQEILEAAREKGNSEYREMLENARRERGEILKGCREEGYEKGYAEGSEAGKAEGWQQGFAEGMQAAEEANEGVMAELKSILDTVEEQREGVLRRNEEDLAALAVQIAKKILKRELAEDAGALRGIIQNAVESYRNQAWIRINVSPSTAQVLLHTNGGIAEALQEVSENVKVVPAPDLGDTDCVIELPDLAIDAGVDSQMGRVEKAMGLNS